MNIVNKLTLRQLKMNKKRTFVTIIGTIISAAMITAVATLGLSFMDIMQRQSIARNGEWHVEYNDINQKQLEGIKSNSKVKTVVLSSEPGYAKLDGSQNQNKPYLYVKYLSAVGFDKFPVKLVEGRLPENKNEIVLNEEVVSNAGVKYSIGDKIDLTIGKRYLTVKNPKKKINEPMLQNYSLQWEKDTVAESLSKDAEQTFTIVGFIKRPMWELNWSPGYSAISYIDPASVTAQNTCDVFVIFKKVNNKLFGLAEKIATDNKITDYGFNNDLLRYYGAIKDDVVKQMLFTFSAIVMVIIVIGSVSLIYNAFAISVSERSRYLGMLSSVGATKRQKRNSVFFEGAVIGVISIPLGIIAGYIGLGITYIFINPLLTGILNTTEGFRLRIYASSLLVTVFVACATILISTYIPARRASNISAIDAIRQVTDVKIKGRQVRTFRLTRRIFGIEGDLGLKNLKRNKGRYKATVFSLIISMILFLVVSTFTDYLRKSLEMTQDGINFDIWASVDSDDDEERDGILKEISTLDHIDEMRIFHVLKANTQLEEEKTAEFVKDNKAAIMIDGKYNYDIMVNVMEDSALKEYAKEIGADYDKLKDGSKSYAIVIDTMKFKDNDADKYVETKLVKTKLGDSFILGVPDGKTEKSIALKPFKVAALTSKLPMGIMSLGNTVGFHIIMSESAFDSMVKDQQDMVSTLISSEIYFNSDNPIQLQTELERVQSEVGVSKLELYNVYNYKDSEQQALILVSVFTYAFIILITIICIANIINTISTSIALRKREFAMLKSIGITPKGFNRMLNYESIFYGIKAIIYGLPISFLAMYLMYHALSVKFDYDFIFPIDSICIVIASVFLIVGTAMLYSSRRVRKENIIDALKQEII